MLVFRLVCAVLLAWAVNWSLSRAEAEELLQVLPEMATLAPIAGAAIGYFNLAVRQGWGVIVAFANGIWAGVLAIFASGALYMCVRIVNGIRDREIREFDHFLNVFSSAIEPMLDQLANLPLLITSLGASAVVGFITEIVHWLLVRVRQGKGGQRRSST